MFSKKSILLESILHFYLESKDTWCDSIVFCCECILYVFGIDDGRKSATNATVDVMQQSLKLFQPATAPLDFLVSENARRLTKCKHLELQVSRDEIEAKRAKLIKPRPKQIQLEIEFACVQLVVCLFYLMQFLAYLAYILYTGDDVLIWFALESQHRFRGS